LPEGRGRSEIEVAVRVWAVFGRDAQCLRVALCILHRGKYPLFGLSSQPEDGRTGELAVVLCKMSFCFGLVTLDGIILLTLTLSPEDQRQTNNLPKTTYSAPHVPARQPKREPPRGASSITLMMLC
jgi:hypothetical protein